MQIKYGAQSLSASRVCVIGIRSKITSSPSFDIGKVLGSLYGLNELVSVSNVRHLSLYLRTEDIGQTSSAKKMSRHDPHCLSMDLVQPETL